MKKFYTTLFFLSIQLIFAQNEAANWYFGENAGINFNSFTGGVTVLDDGKLFTREGCASISNGDGNLLFYTDGVTVYNKNHEQMPNGDNLLGDSSSTQSALIIPLPNSNTLFYLFTVGSNQNNTGLKYSIVDISLDNGLGDVISKNSNLLSRCAEKILAVSKDCSSGSIWVISTSNINGDGIDNLNTFFAFELSENGINTTPIKSTFNIDISDTRGYLKINSDGTKIASANVTSGLYLFDFDAANGIVSSPNKITISFSQANLPYGVEFSPDGEILYVSSSNDFNGSFTENLDPNNHISTLIQYNLNAANISQSYTVLDSRNLYRGGLQLGLDGKIYRALSETYDTGLPYLGIINNPNTLGMEANYNHEGVFLGSKKSTQGLPPFVQSLFNNKMDIINNGNSTTSITLCQGDTYTLVADEIFGATYNWTKDGVAIANNTNTLNVLETGEYEVIVFLDSKGCKTKTGSAKVNFVSFPEVNNTILQQCDDEIIDGKSFFNLNNAINGITNNNNNSNLHVTFYLTENDAKNDINRLNSTYYENISNPQIIYASVINESLLASNPQSNSCYSFAEVLLEVVDNSLLKQVNYSICDDDIPDGITSIYLDDVTSYLQSSFNFNYSISYYFNFNDAILQENQLDSSFINSTPYSEKIYARIEDNDNCECITVIDLSIEALPEVNEVETITYCKNTYPETITISAGLLNDNETDYNYYWSTNETSSTIKINTIGTYTVNITNTLGCSIVRTINVEASNIAIIDNIEITDVSKFNKISVIVSGSGDYQYSLTNITNSEVYPYQSNNIFENVSPGIYEVNVMDVKNDCGVTSETISVIGFPKYFTPNNDGVNDLWQVYGISELFQPESKIKIFNRYGKLLKIITPNNAGWDGNYKGKMLPQDDYWFEVILQDGRVYKNHFSLKL